MPNSMLSRLPVLVLIALQLGCRCGRECRGDDDCEWPQGCFEGSCIECDWSGCAPGLVCCLQGGGLVCVPEANCPGSDAGPGRDAGDAAPLDAGPLIDDCRFGPTVVSLRVASPDPLASPGWFPLSGEATVTVHDLLPPDAYAADYSIEFMSNGSYLVLEYALAEDEAIPATVGEDVYLDVTVEVKGPSVGTMAIVRDSTSGTPGALRAIVWDEFDWSMNFQAELAWTYQAADCLASALDACGPSRSWDLLADIYGSGETARVPAGTSMLVEPFRVGNGASYGYSGRPPVCIDVPDMGYARGSIVVLP